MSVRNAGTAIREARKKAGLSQEKLSDGICSLLSLSRIENGTAGISPATFQALMAHAGAPCEIYPMFENWDDYNCFFYLKHARFHLNAWQLASAYENLEKTEQITWNNNKFYYQEWLMLHGMLQFRSGKGDHQQMYDTFLAALHVTRPDINLHDFRNLLLSINEIELLIAIAQEALYLNRLEACLQICSQIQVYLTNSQITSMEKDILFAEYAIVFTKYLIAIGSYEDAWKLADTHRHQMVLVRCDAPLFELTFLTGLCDYHLGNVEDALSHFKDTFYAAHAIQSSYAAICRNYVKKQLKLDLPAHLLSIPDITPEDFATKNITNTTAFSDGIYDIYGPDVITIGRLIRELRIQQKVSQQVLCQGLCSKSKLSKIENGTLNPEIILAETLLQRLGISEREFTFYGNARETQFHDLKFKLLRSFHLNTSERKQDLEKLNHFITEKDFLYKQFFLFNEYELHRLDADTSFETRFSILEKALNCTLKNFDIYNITSYRLSWMELTILNCLAYEYRYTNTPYQGIIYFRQLLAYWLTIKPDCILPSQTYTITLHLFVHLLYSQKYFREIVDLYNNMDMSILSYRIERYSMIYFYYSQSLGECFQYDKLVFPACYACGIENILEIPEHSNILQTAIQNDFSINITY